LIHLIQSILTLSWYARQLNPLDINFVELFLKDTFDLTYYT